MEKVRETTIALIILFLVIGTLFIIYSLLMWQVLPKALGLALLFALALLKNSIYKLRSRNATEELNKQDIRLLKFLIFSITSVFLIIVYISYLLKFQQVMALLTLGISLLAIKRSLDFLPFE